MAPVPADRIHLVRHGEVHNPRGVIYERLDGFGLSELGQRMAQAAADELVGARTPATALWASPLQRTRESAAPIAAAFGHEVHTDERFLEAQNRFRGKASPLKDPRSWPFLLWPVRPSWGEPFRQVADRVLAGMHELRESTPSGDVIVVTHQLPIWMAHRAVAGEPLMHHPGHRRCSLSSITTFTWDGGRFIETDYREPAKQLLAHAVDEGAT